VTGVAPRVEARSKEIARRTPEWRPWLDRLDAALAEDASRRFDGAAVSLASDRPPGAPWLLGARIALPAKETPRWLARCFSRRFARRHGLEALSFAIQGDAPRLDALAVVAGEDPQSLAARSSACAMPVLHAFRRRVDREPPATEGRGTCPVCGAWPALAESRGLERARRLRCGRCGGDWALAWLRCVFCGETDHRRQGSLVPESGGEARRVETCASCRGYVKTVATVGGFSAEAVALEDLATVDLDVVAIERDFRRPRAEVVPCAVTVGTESP
jgi:ribosomal protein S27AE